MHSEARLQVFKTKIVIFIFRVSSSCKYVGALLWYIEQEVRLVNNQTCKSKPQKWHVLSKKQKRLHGPVILNEIERKKQWGEKILQEESNKTVCHSKFDLRAEVDRRTNPITDNDLDVLEDATNGKCGIVLLMRSIM